MLLKGVTQEEYNEILSILVKYDAEFYAYGSRKKGDYTKSSDLDIMVKTNDFDQIIGSLKEDFDNSHISYIVNFTDGNNISEQFYSYIKNDLVKLN